MPNHHHTTPPAGPRRHALPIDRLADPRVVLLAVGLLGLAVDLFVRPISWIGLALIVLATMPWILQAWAQRLPPAAPAPRPRIAHDGARTGQGGGAAGPDPRPVRTQPATAPARDPAQAAPRPAPAAGATVAAGQAPRRVG